MQPLSHRMTGRWMLAATTGALALVALVYFAFPHGDKLGTALRYTARWSFLWFTLATCGGALLTLFGTHFEWLAQRARDFGLAFASAHSVHVALVAWYLFSNPERRSAATLLFFGTGVILMYVMALLSLSGAWRAAVSPRTGRLIRTLGTEYIAYIFIADFYARAAHEPGADIRVYAVFVALSVAGPLLRIAARLKRWRDSLMSGGHGLKPGHAA